MAVQSGKTRDFLEVVDSYTPTASGITSHSFDYDGKRTAYLLVTEPFGTIEEMRGNEQLPSGGQLVAIYFAISGASGTPATRSVACTTLRPNVANYIDYWTISVSPTETQLTIDITSARLEYMPGYKYVLYRFAI